MKILLVSDSHGRKEELNDLINSENWDYVLFAGDGLRDLGCSIYDPKFIYVRGNCDFFAQDEPITQTIFVGSYKILLTHGDYYKVKLGLENLHAFAVSKGYNVVCYGHTHEKFQKEIDGVKYINPGSFKTGNYAEIYIRDNQLTLNMKNING